MDNKQTLHISFSAVVSFALVLMTSVWVSVYLPVSPMAKITLVASLVPWVWVPLFFYLIHCRHSWTRFFVHSTLASAWAIPLVLFFTGGYAELL